MYTITPNATFGSIEITFTEKPSEEIRAALKSMKFRYHRIKNLWYGYAEEAAVRKALESPEAPAKKGDKPTAKPAKKNKFGVQVGDIFCCSWGYEQTNNTFFQVIALAGEYSVRVREVYPEMIDEQATGPMASDKTYRISRKILPAAYNSVFIKNQVDGDLKRLKSYAADGVSNPCFNVDSFASASLVVSDTIKVYDSWYA